MLFTQLKCGAGEVGEGVGRECGEGVWGGGCGEGVWGGSVGRIQKEPGSFLLLVPTSEF
jgi:hypothetical protein